jgi:hypothetical protein
MRAVPVPRTCTICEHPDRERIDQALVGDTSNLSVSSLFAVSEQALRRHKSNHLPAKLSLATAAEEIAEADSLLDQVRDLQSRAYAILNRAEKTGELRTALSAIREARGNLELLAKLLGELDERPVVNLNLSPEWLELRTVIVGALGAHPEALRAVVGALSESSAEAGVTNG